jgi:hypothetical protein
VRDQAGAKYRAAAVCRPSDVVGLSNWGIW